MGEIWSALIGVGSAFVVGLLGYFGVVRQTKPTEASLVLEAWKDLLDPLKQELADANLKIVELTVALEQEKAARRADREAFMVEIRNLQLQLEDKKNKD